MNWRILSLIALVLAGIVRANPFFAMDTAVRSLDELDVVKRLGYDGVGWKTESPGQLAADAQQIRQHGLKLFVIYGYVGATLTKTNLTWNSQLEADIAVLKGTGTIIWLPIASQDFPKSSSSGDAVAVPALQRLADFAASNGVRIALYPHTWNWVERVQDAVRLAKLVNRPNFGATFNLCHCLMVGDEGKIPELLAEASPHLFLVTINGADAGAATPGWDRLIQPLDAGSYDVGIVLRKLKELNYAGPIGLQGYGVKLPVKENLCQNSFKMSPLALRRKCPLFSLFVPHQVAAVV
ncbi:MAG: sugar phosphate isomerase/epimerase family protein, partial [Limisphaerales bacterium]